MKILKRASRMDDRPEILPYLPPEIILNILSRIPIRTVFTCKCVSKSWLELLQSPEFARSHLSNSVPGLLIHHFDETTNGTDTDTFKIFGFERRERHYKRVLQLKSESTLDDDSAPSISEIVGSTNGFLCFTKLAPAREDYYICNPITHECLRLPKPERTPGSGSIVADGFGASRLSNQYKVVAIFSGFVCQVYTLGTRSSWRSVAALREEILDCSTGRLANGNLHWLTVDYSTVTQWISRFDLETEVFTRSRPPKLSLEGPLMEIGVFGDRLCAYEFLLSSTNEIVIYLMTDDGHGKESWNKEYVIGGIPPYGPFNTVYPLKGFGDDSVLLSLDYVWSLCSSTRTEVVAQADVLNEEIKDYSAAILYTPSFISLKDFETENAKVSEFVCSIELAS